MALYVAVMAVALIVSVLGLAGLTVVRIERQRANAATDLIAARQNARSGIEWGLAGSGTNANWRTTIASGTESSQLSVGSNAQGTVSWILKDTDGSLSNTDIDLQLTGIGRAGRALQVSRVRVAAAGTASAEQVWHDEYRPGQSTNFQLQANSGVGVRFIPALPVNATRWSITRVLVWSQKIQNGSLEARVTTLDASGLPQSVVNSVTVSTNSFPATFDWQEISFPAAAGLAPNEAMGVVLLFKSGSSSILQVGYGANSNGSPTTSMLTTSNDGSTWTSQS
ncbi:MAG: hypothetical protein B7Z55_09745, partial [Planctomycetales bacterium 12-60-4]